MRHFTQNGLHKDQDFMPKTWVILGNFGIERKITHSLYHILSISLKITDVLL